MDEPMQKTIVKAYLENDAWVVLPEFGIRLDGTIKQIDLTSFKWKDDREIQAVAFECKCVGTAQESYLAALGQVLEYQLLFPEASIVTEGDELFEYQESILKKLGLGYIMVNDKGEYAIVMEPSIENNDSFDEKLFTGQVRNRAILALVFSELFPDSYKAGHFGGLKQGELWLHNKPKGNVQYRAWTMIGGDSYLGINVEAVHLIKNIVGNMDMDKLLEIFSRLPPKYTVDLAERATRIDKDGNRILDRQKGSVSIKGSIFEKGGIQASSLTKEQIQDEIADRSKELSFYSHLIIDSKVWDIESEFTREQYLEEMRKTIETLNEVYNILEVWSK